MYILQVEPLGDRGRVRELLSTNDPVLLSFVEALLRDARIHAVVLDRHMSAMDGSIGALPRRVLVATADWRQACLVFDDAGLSKWLTEHDLA